jgi:predicted nucleic acid-binding protein
MPKHLDEFSGDRIYIEPNILLFDALADVRFGRSSLEFLKRGSQGEFELLTSSLTVDEIAFVALKVKLEEKYKVTKGHVHYLKQHPEVVKALAPEIGGVLDNVRRLCTIVEVHESDIERMQEYMRSFGLLPRDAIHLAVARRMGLTCIASSDKDFDRVNWLSRYEPRGL